MIKSILDNDLYKFTMQNAVIKLFPYGKAKYKFINRGKTQFPEGFAVELQNHISLMSELKLRRDEKKFLQDKCLYLPPTYIDFLRGYRFDPDEVKVTQNGGNLDITIEGYWYRTILWEVPLMALVSELYFKMTKAEHWNNEKIIEKVKEKADKYNELGIKVADFGTRRRFSYKNHELVVKTLKEHGQPAFIGTSNVYLAYKYCVSPIGTHAHEWFMYHAAKYGYKMANKMALDNWVAVYRGNLGIALADTFTSKAFFRTFDTKLAKLFDGVRHDSGDPIEFAKATIEHYEKLKIDPKSKTIVFSDGLNPEMVERIVEYCNGKINMSFGIGTNFTNDVGVKPLNIVIKMTEAKTENQDWTHTVKLSDVEGKHTGTEDDVLFVKKVLNI